MMIHELGLTPPDEEDSPIKSGEFLSCFGIVIATPDIIITCSRSYLKVETISSRIFSSKSKM